MPLKKDLKKIVQTYYESLEDGRIMGRRCHTCGHMEYPPYLACNHCGALDTEWEEIPHHAVVKQLVVPSPAYKEPEFSGRVGAYVVANVQIDDADELATCLLGVSPEQVEDLRDKLPLEVHPVIAQDDGFKVVYWKLNEPGKVGWDEPEFLTEPAKADVA